jgi:hypothetical protein
MGEGWRRDAHNTNSPRHRFEPSTVKERRVSRSNAGEGPLDPPERRSIAAPAVELHWNSTATLEARSLRGYRLHDHGGTPSWAIAS